MTDVHDPTSLEPVLVEIDAELEELLPGFLAHRRADVTVILDAVARGDFETARLLGHSMKGLGSAYGLDPISELGREIEAAATAARIEPIHAAVCRLDHFLARLRISYV